MLAYLYGYIIGVLICKHTLEIADHGYKIRERFEGSGSETEFCRTAEYFVHRNILFVGIDHAFFNRGFTNTPCRVIDDAF